MPRSPRLDAPGVVHHVMARGNERRPIFRDNVDYENFIARIEKAHAKAPVEILAWALMPNHIHFLLRSGPRGIASFMRRLLGGHASYFNRRHRRVGHLFQDRFKSLVCEEDPYLLQLVRYIHLNPLVAGLVTSMNALARYPYVSHSALLGKAHYSWQSVDEVLRLFGRRETSARQHYLTFLHDGLALTTTTDELGGGLVQEFAQAVGRVRRGAERELYDGRVLGEGEFVQQVLEKADKREKVAQTLERRGWELRRLAQASADEFGVTVREVFERGRRDPVSRAKSLVIFVAAEYAGQSLTTLSRATQMSTAGASKSRERGAVLYERSRLKGTLSKLIS